MEEDAKLVKDAAKLPVEERIKANIADAVMAAMEFKAKENALEKANAVTANPRLSLIGAAAKWAGWTDDLMVLELPGLVMKPDKAHAVKFDMMNVSTGHCDEV